VPQLTSGSTDLLAGSPIPDAAIRRSGRTIALEHLEHRPSPQATCRATKLASSDAEADGDGAKSRRRAELP
jgi:hypothetical protein